MTEERRRILAAGGSFFLFRYSGNILFLLLMTLFLKRVGADYLAYQYMLANGLSMAGQAYLMRNQGWSNSRLLLGNVIANCAMAMLFAVIPSLAISPVVLFLALVAATVLETIIMTALIEAINALFSVREFKIVGPGVFGVGTIGNIAAGLTLKLLGDLAGMHAIFVAGGLSCLLFAASVVYLVRCAPHGEAAVKRPEGPPSPREGGGGGCGNEDLPTLRETLEAFPLGKVVILLGFLTFFARFLLDYEFSALLSDFSKSEGELVAFFGMFSSFLELTMALAQLTVVTRIFNTLKIGKTLCIAPSLMVIFSLIILFYPNIYLVFLFQFAFNLTFRSLFGTGITYLLNPMPSAHRKQLRVASSFGLTSGILGCGLFLVLCKSLLNTVFVMATLLPLALLVLHIIMKLDRGYVQILLASSEQAPKSEDLLRLPDEQRTQRLVSWLQSEASARAIRAAVKSLHEQAPADLRKALVRLLDGEPAPEQTRATANLVEALGELRELGDVDALVLPYLDSLNIRLRSAAILCLVPAAHDPAVVERAADTLRGLLTSTEELQRSSAAVVMGKLKRGVFVPALDRLLADPASAVVKNAIVALGLINSPQALAALHRFAQESEGELQAYARKVRRHVQRAVLRQLSSLSEGVSREERLALGAVFEDLAGIEQVDLLARLMRLPDSPTRLALARLLKQYPDAGTLAAVDAVLRSPHNDVRAALRLAWDNGYLCTRGTLELVRLFLDEANQAHLTEFLEKLSDELWLYTMIAQKAGADVAAARHCRRAQVRLVCLIFQISLALAGQDAEGLRSVKPLLGRDPASRARAIEVFDAMLPNRMNRRFIPLLEHLSAPAEKPAAAPPAHLTAHAETVRASALAELLDEQGRQRLQG